MDATSSTQHISTVSVLFSGSVVHFNFTEPDDYSFFVLFLSKKNRLSVTEFCVCVFLLFWFGDAFASNRPLYLLSLHSFVGGLCAVIAS